MGVVFRQSVKTTAVTFLGAVLGAVLVLVSSSLMPEQELGFSRNLTNQTVVASFFLMMGMSSTLFLFFHRYDKEADHRKRAVFLSLCFLVPLGAFAVAMIPYFVFPDYFINRFFQVQDRAFMKKYLLCFPLYTLFYLYTTLLEHYLLTQIKSAASSFVREVLLKGLNLCLVLLYGFDLINYDVFIYGFVGTNLLAVLILLLLACKNKSFHFSTQWSLLSKKEYREILSFAGYHALMGVSFSLFGFLDAVLLASLDENGLAAVPAYTNAVFISGVMTIPYRAMNGIASADISKSYALGHLDKVKDAYSRSALNILIATVFMAVVIAANLHNAVAIMPASYAAVFSLTLIMMIGKFIDSSTGLNDVALNMSPFYKLNFYFSAGMVVFMMVAYRIFIPRFGVYGAAWVFTAALALYNILKTLVVWKKMGLNPFSKGTLIALLIGGLSYSINYLLPFQTNPYWDTLFRSVLVGLVFLLLILWLKPSKDIEHYVHNTLKKKKLF